MNPNDSTDKLVEMCAIFTQNTPNRMAYRFLESLFGENVTINIAINVSKNIKLFRLFQISECEKFISIDSALAALNRDEKSKQLALIHFTELNLYGMFTPEQYMRFTNNLTDKIYDNINISFRPKQIILAGLPQKLIFICVGGEDIVEKIRVCVEKKYGCGITHTVTEDYIEITVQGMGGNTYEESQKTYYDLLSSINKEQNDNTLIKKILPMPITKHNGQNFIIADISYDLTKPQNLNNIIESLKTIHEGNLIINMVIVNGNVNGGNIIMGNQNNNIDNDPSVKTLNWIRTNLPNQKEITTEYYNRYLANFNDIKISNNQFGKLVRSQGFKPIRGTHHRFWVKK